jgi:hypothetical protein
MIRTSPGPHWGPRDSIRVHLVCLSRRGLISHPPLVRAVAADPMRKIPVAVPAADLGAFIAQELAATQVAIGCLRMVAHLALTEFEAKGDHDGTRLLGAGVPGGGWIAPVHGIAGARVLVAEMAEGGITHQRLTQQWIITVYTGWDAECRKRRSADPTEMPR